MAEGPAGKRKQTALKRRILLKIRIKMTRNISEPLSEHKWQQAINRSHAACGGMKIQVGWGTSRLEEAKSTETENHAQSKN